MSKWRCGATTLGAVVTASNGSRRRAVQILIALGASPVRAQVAERLVKVYGDATALADNHRLAVGSLRAFPDVRRQFGGGRAQFGNATPPIDRHRCRVGDGAMDVADGNTIAEDRPRVPVRFLDRRAGEPDER